MIGVYLSFTLKVHHRWSNELGIKTILFDDDNRDRNSLNAGIFPFSGYTDSQRRCIMFTGKFVEIYKGN